MQVSAVSRPYGDGLFYHSKYSELLMTVPSLRGRIVLLKNPFPANMGRPVPTGTDCSEVYNALNRITLVPSLRGRIVPLRYPTIHKNLRPVPTGTDCSYGRTFIRIGILSRPYGDGLFLAFNVGRKHKPGPVPTGTDCSNSAFPRRYQWSSRPYGDGLFLKIRLEGVHMEVPSLRGRIVPTLFHPLHVPAGPVPTGTDCSFEPTADGLTG